MHIDYGADCCIGGNANLIVMRSKGSSKYYIIKRCHPLVWGDDASVETGVGGQAKYYMLVAW